MTEITGPSSRIRDAAESFGLSVMIRIMPESTRTAEEAAAACGCSVGEIVKSLVFRGRESGEAVLLLVSGKNRVDEAKAASAVGEPIERPDAAFVRSVTGFSIGGIPPFGHLTRLRTFIDADLLAYDQVFAAAGTPNSLFAVSPRALQAGINASVATLR